LPRLDHNRAELTWLGHATVAIEMHGVRLLTDPVLGRRVGVLRRVAPPLPRDLADRPPAAILISHLHGDHVDVPSLRRFGRDVPILAPPAAARWLRRRRFRDVRELAPGAAAEVRGVRVEGVDAEHDGRRWPQGRDEQALGFLIEGPPSVYFAGDTDLFPEMRELGGRVDVALLPVAGWGPTLGPGHLDPERAAEAARVIAPGLAIPIHFGTLAPSWLRVHRGALAAPAREFAAAARRVAPQVEVTVLEPTERVVVRAPRTEEVRP
jgi:L-ascorbate metabolism protein UlaG (beta-lactamase superfamily)